MAYVAPQPKRSNRLLLTPLFLQASFRLPFGSEFTSSKEHGCKDYPEYIFNAVLTQFSRIPSSSAIFCCFDLFCALLFRVYHLTKLLGKRRIPMVVSKCCSLELLYLIILKIIPHRSRKYFL
ncbi:hypothetical protein N431DRAFT_60914 [Stipitochalara longipes BDJ]|nr:hypothetical protein N431DRAFT_60914 [Stipitochalara longipes BDJ]